MSYGGPSNGPWQRNMVQSHQQSSGFHQGSQMFMQNNMAAFGSMPGVGNMYPGGGGGNSIAYPQPRSGLNPAAFQQGGGDVSHYNSIGTVTKISNDCGLINDEIFFYRNACKGREPVLGDRVLFEATYSTSGQFKWNATRVQLMPQPQPLMTTNKTSFSAVAPPNEYKRSQVRRTSPKRSPVRSRNERDRPHLHRSRDRDEEERERKRRREDHVRETENKSRSGGDVRGGNNARNEKDRDRGEPRKKERNVSERDREDRERGKEKSHVSELETPHSGAKDRRIRNRKRYMVKIPKRLLTITNADIQDLRQRYIALYIPSDFFLTNIKWPGTFTPDKPFSLRRPCQFHIMDEVVESPTEHDMDLLEPADANYLYSAKVMLMSLPPIAEIYKKCFENDGDVEHHPTHPSRLINFLVGVKGRVGSMAIGGPWSPSLDGENPDKDPSVLIRTAIRTCKALTGIDLSSCTQWYRFVEFYYHRTEYKNMEKDGPPRVETVVIYLPDVHSCMPSIEEWQSLTQVYKSAADSVVARRSALIAAGDTETNDDNDELNDDEMLDSSRLAEDDAEEDSNGNSYHDVEGEAENIEEFTTAQNEEGEEEKMECSTVDLSDANDDNVDNITGAEVKEEPDHEIAAADDENNVPVPEPTHYSELDLKSMNVQDMRDELLARNLSDKGVRNVIMARLAKALNIEKSEESKNKHRNEHQNSNGTNNISKSNEDKIELDKKVAVEIKKKNDKMGIDDNVNGKPKVTKSVNDKKNASEVKIEKDADDLANIIDFELSDIVVLDEYDSRKNTEEINLKDMSEKELNRLIRHHTLPSTPHIIVHPNRKAKEGKFDCAIAPLSALLDYHPDDSKERFFEVSLFAELFNEMLLRDFGFNIYKELYLYEDSGNISNDSDPNDVNHEADANMNENEKGDKIARASKEKDNEKKASKSSSGDKAVKEPQNDDKKIVKAESRKRKISSSNSIANSKDLELATSDKKMVVVKPQLLLSFVYFDTTNCGYILEQDLEDLFMVLGLNLSRSQIKKLLGMCKLGKYHAIHYSKLTHKEESLVSTPTLEDIDDLPVEQLKQIAAGNNQYQSVFGQSFAHNQLSAVEGDNDNNEGFVNFNGTIVHVGKLLNQINRSEKNFSDLEKVYKDLLKQHSDLQKDHTKSSAKVKDLQAEIKNVSRKLTDANQDYYSLNRKYRDQNATLSYIYTRVAPYFSREKDKEKDPKSEVAHDKEKEMEYTKEDKEKDVKKVDNRKQVNDKELVKDEKENTNVKVSEQDKIKSEHGKEPEKVVKDEKDTVKKGKDGKEKETSLVVIDKEKTQALKEKEKELEKDNEKIKPKDEKDKEKVKVEKDKEKEKPEEENEKLKENKEKEPIKIIKAKVSLKSGMEKEKPKEDKPQIKVTVDKEKQGVTNIKITPTPQKNIVGKPKPITPAAKKVINSKPTGKVIKKSDNVGVKK